MVDEAMDYFTEVVLGSPRDNGNASELHSNRYTKGIELVIVDDGSTDGTTQVAVTIAQKWDKSLRELRTASSSNVPIEIRVITLERNHGKGGAVRHVRVRLSLCLLPLLTIDHPSQLLR
jgi:dolichyl-phosphate beta-glucosyltransferase